MAIQKEWERVIGLVSVETSRLAVVSPKDDQTWNEVIRSDLKERKIIKDITKENNAWKSFMRNPSIHASMKNRF